MDNKASIGPAGPSLRSVHSHQEPQVNNSQQGDPCRRLDKNGALFSRQRGTSENPIPTRPSGEYRNFRRNTRALCTEQTTVQYYWILAAFFSYYRRDTLDPALEGTAETLPEDER